MRTRKLKKRRSTYLYWLSVGSILLSGLLLMVQLTSFSRGRSTYPEGMKIAGVPVGNLDRLETANRLLEVFSKPVELNYNENVIHLNPAIVGFELDLESMLAAADLQRLSGTFWTEFWAFLWNSETDPESIPMGAIYSENLLREFLTNEISPRYDQPPTPAKPIQGQIIFEQGKQGTELNIESNIFQIKNALYSPSYRSINLSIQKSSAPPPSFLNLEILLKQTIDLSGFDGVTGVYVLDLLTGDEIHFILDNGNIVSTEPDLAFTASSTIKIPIMVSAFNHLPDNPNPEAINLMTKMITESGNDPADWLMQQFINEDSSPLQVTSEMHDLGLENTFLAGHFYLGARLMQLFETEANTRTDVNIDRDIYNQTTLSDMGQLLADIYMCEQSNGGALMAVFKGQVTQEECRLMIELLTQNYMPYLIGASASEALGIRIAHKHGWSSNASGVTTAVSDAGIVYTPNNDYVVVFNFYHPVQLLWESPNISVSKLGGDLAKAIYNYFTISK